MRRALLPLSAMLLTSCDALPMTWAEVSAALEESQTTARVDGFTSGIVEISTDFTMGQAVEDAAEELRAFLESQVPCSTVTRSNLTVTMDFGTLDDDCVWNGRTYAGVSQISLAELTDTTATIEHAWIGMTDGEITMDGGATVTWDADQASRHVTHEIVWTDAEGVERIGGGDRTQTLIDRDAGIEAGIVVQGSRDWATPDGDWVLSINDVEMRPQDPVPQDGEYQLANPKGKTATLTFARLDDDTIEVVLSGGREDHVWHVTSIGATYQES